MNSSRSTRFYRSLLLLFVLPQMVMSSRAQQPPSPSAPALAPQSQPSADSPASPREDWTTPLLDRVPFGSVKPLVLASNDDIPGSGFTRQRYEVEWRAKDPFDLYIIRPRGVAKPPVILTLYSYPDDTENFKNNTWCEDATKNGYAIVGFVAAVTGHRVRFHSPQSWFVSEMQESLGATSHDVQLILDYLARRGDLDVTRVGMFGVGSGGSIAILASAVDSRIVALDLLGPWGDWPGWLAESKIVRDDERTPFLKPDFLDKVAPLDPISWLPKSKAVSLRLQSVRHNISMPDKSQEKLEAAVPDFAVINQYGNGRAFLKAQPSIALFDWIKDQLKPGAKPIRLVSEKSQRVHVYPAIDTPADNWPNVGKLDVSKPKDAAANSSKPNEQNIP